MGISIKYYRISKAENAKDLVDLEKEIEAAKDTVLDLYQMTLDLGIIFLNTADPYEDTNAIGYKILFGNYIREVTGDYVCNGFIPTSEIPLINQWIKEKQLESLEGFRKLFDNISDEAKEELIAADSPSVEDLYSGYVVQLVKFYDAAQKENNSVIIRGE